MAQYPSFTSFPHIDLAVVSAANTNRDGTGTTVDLITGRNAIHLNYASTSALVAGQGSQTAKRFYYVVNAAATNGGDVYEWTGMTAGTTADYRKLSDAEALAVLTSKGTRVSKITVHATATTTAGMIRLYVYDGTNVRIHKELVVTAITVSASVAAFEGTFTFTDGFILPTGCVFRASTHNAETFHLVVESSDF